MLFDPLEFEIWFGHFVQGFSGESLDALFLAITLLGNPMVWVGIAAFLYWKGEEKKSFFLTTTLLFSAAIVGFLKPVFARLRPDAGEFRVLVNETDSIYGLPSGHATTISGIFGYYYEKFRKNAKILGAIIVLLVLLSRIYLGAHFLGDVVLGGLFGFLIGRMVHAFEEKFPKIKGNGKKLLEETGLIAVILAAILIALVLQPLSATMGLLGFFAGALAFKLLGFDSKRLAGKELLVKEGIGFAGLGFFYLFITDPFLEIWAVFAAGLWITLGYPALYEELSKKTAK